MKKSKEILKNIRLKINKIGANRRNKKLKSYDFSVISNNCFAGIVYQHLGLQYNTPTIGLYFFPKEYINFVENFNYYINIELKFIETRNSKYYNILKERNQDKAIIGVLDDVEIVFLHYKTREEALTKWNKRKNRLSKNLIFKFNDQNFATFDDIGRFDKIKVKNKICFTAKKYAIFSSTIQIKKYSKCNEIKEDYYSCYRYIDLISYINTKVFEK